MVKSILSSWMRTRKNNTMARVGDFYAHLVQAVLGGEIKGAADNGPDLVNEELLFEAEIKSSDNNHNFRISTLQRDRHLDRLQFPFSFMYCLCSYRNSTTTKVRGRRGPNFSLLARMKTKFDQHNLLASKTDEIFIFDIEVITAYEREFGTRVGMFVGRETEQNIILRRQDIRPLWNGGRDEIMSKLKLKPKKWKFGRFELRVPLSIDGSIHSVDCVLLTMLKPELHRELLRLPRLPSNMLEKKGATK